MEEVPLLKALDTKYAGRAAIVGIGLDSNVRRADRTIKDKGMTWPQLVDGKAFDGTIAKTYGVNGTPTIFVLDRAGRIVARPGSAKQIEEGLALAFDGR
ncbi:MAG TPA: TlpA disulfide reductase family protein [Xanthobacteraceae bacterium]|jgi:thiol-disulfide isomerase/thioredoxin